MGLGSRPRTARPQVPSRSVKLDQTFIRSPYSSRLFCVLPELCRAAVTCTCTCTYMCMCMCMCISMCTHVHVHVHVSCVSGHRFLDIFSAVRYFRYRLDARARYGSSVSAGYSPRRRPPRPRPGPAPAFLFVQASAEPTEVIYIYIYMLPTASDDLVWPAARQMVRLVRNRDCPVPKTPAVRSTYTSRVRAGEAVVRRGCTTGQVRALASAVHRGLRVPPPAHPTAR